MLQEQKFQHKQMFELWIHNKKLHAGTSGTTESPAVRILDFCFQLVLARWDTRS